jgi:redox-sensitive bicupin YhaK (pirin superfamily)
MDKKVKYTLPATILDMGGIPVRQAFPTQKIENIGPFILLHHGSFQIPEKSKALHHGVGPHPHSGFEPVSIVLNGEVHHRDSLGNSSIIARGGVQWVRSGKGIVHSERPSQALADSGGVMEVIQLWINTPASLKKHPAGYESVKKDDIQRVNSAEGVEIHLISGELDGKVGSIKPSSDLILAMAYIDNEKTLSLKVPMGFEAAFYIAEGSGEIPHFGLSEQFSAYVFENDGDVVNYKAREYSRILVMMGKPLNEPVASYGPFVLNNQSEILSAMRDYQMGKMGVLIEE